ncbi:uncharacterized protein LOC144661030 [Oculina patagonica]
MSTVSERFPASLPLMDATRNHYGSVELRVLNHDNINNETSSETGRELWNVDHLEKRTTQVFKALQVLGLVMGERSRRLGCLFIRLIAVIAWVPATFLSICVAKNPIMSSPSGLPTVLLFSGLALSHHFGALYVFRHRGRLRRNVYLAIERANFCRTCVIVISVFGILTLTYLVLLVYLYATQPIHPVPWLQICVIYFLGYIYCASVSVAMNLMFSAVCAAINIRINDFKCKFRNWSEGLREALNEYQELCNFMHHEVEAIKWWLLVNVISFFVIWLVDFHLWQILTSEAGETNVVRLVFYNCSLREPLPAPKLTLPDGLITGCEMLFSSLVFFFFIFPLYWAAMLNVHCNKFREWINCTRVQTDDRPLGHFSITSLDFFINRVQVASYFAFKLKLCGINVTKVVIFVTGFMTTVRFVMDIMMKKLLHS